VRTVRTGPAIGLIAQLALLGVLAGSVGVGVAGWLAGAAWGVATYVILARGLARSGDDRLGPADRVTLIRATLVGGVTALVADAFDRSVSVPTLVALAGVALILDAVDGWVARRTETVSGLGALFDMEVDAFLILVLSVYAAHAVGGWVIAIGAARYAFGLAGRLLPWMHGSLPPRYWRKVVAATQGIVLAAAATGALPTAAAVVALAAALALLAESFGRDVWWLSRRRSGRPVRRIAGRTPVVHVEVVGRGMVEPARIAVPATEAGMYGQDGD
jgi:phosphatidylglycerophosphate synthase